MCSIESFQKINYIVIHYQKMFDLFPYFMCQCLQGHRKKKFMDKKRGLEWEACDSLRQSNSIHSYLWHLEEIRHTAIQNSQTSSACVQRTTKRHQLLL